jgi:type II secretory pathway component GspD/PulD (secretin)
MKAFLVCLVLLSFGARAADECAELGKCVELVSKLTGKKYLYDAKSVKGGLQSTSNASLTSENADTLFTYILDLNGYARVPTPEKDTYLIVESRDIRFQALPSIKVDAETPPKLAPNADYYMMTYTFKNHTHGQLRMASNVLRPFMSRNARTIEAGKFLTIQENAAKLVLAYETIKSFDRELTKEELAKQVEWEKERKQERKEGLREGQGEGRGEGHGEKLKDQHGKKAEEKTDKREDKK